jgi:RNA binding exosome subunit
MEPARILSIGLSVLSHATEDKDKVMGAVREVCPEYVSGITKTARVRGHYGNEIMILHMKASSAKQADQCFVHLWGRLRSGDRAIIRSRISDFTDSSGTLFLRIDKEESSRGRILLGESDSIKVEVRFGLRGLPRNAMLEAIESHLMSIPDTEIRSPTILEE